MKTLTASDFQPLAQKSVHPELWIGTWSMSGFNYGFSDQREALKTLDFALESGLRHFDTASVYGKGSSNELLRPIISNSRQELFISSKAGLVWQGNDVLHDGSLSGLKTALRHNLDQLNTDYLDLFSLHWPDPKIPIDESIDALKSLQKEGLIRYWGVCNMTTVDERVPIQLDYNPLCPSPFPSKGLACAVSPLAKGKLTSKTYTQLGKKDHRKKHRWFQHQLKEGFNNINDIEAKVLQWCLKRCSVVIAGPRTCVQLEKLKRLFELKSLDKELDHYLDHLHCDS